MDHFAELLYGNTHTKTTFYVLQEKEYMLLDSLAG